MPIPICHLSLSAFGIYIPCVIYFRLKNALPFFQWMIYYEFQPLIQKYEAYLSNYLDNWIIAALEGKEGLALHRRITHEFLELLQKLSYFLKMGKCKFKQLSIEFLEWLIM
jgi:hypothetical protein